MGVGQLGGDIELEVLVVGDHRVAQFDHQITLLLERLLDAGKQQLGFLLIRLL